MHELLALACRAFPPDYRARRSGELLDTALLAADGSSRRATLEAVSLVAAGIRERFRAELHRSPRDGAALLAGILAVVNLAVALGGIALALRPRAVFFGFGLSTYAFHNPYVVDWWWIAFVAAATATVLGLALGSRRLALCAAFANFGFLAYDQIAGRGHLDVFMYLSWGFPTRWTWLPLAAVLVLATAAAPPRRLPLWRLSLALVAAVLLVVISRDADGSSFFFLRWPAAVIVVLGMAFGWLTPRLAVLAIGVSLAVAPIVVGYLSVSYAYHDPVVKWVAAPGLALGLLLPFAYLTRRPLT